MMTRRNRLSTAVLIIALLLTASGSAWAGALAWAESKTVYYRSNLTVVIDGRVTTPEVTPFIVEPGWLMVPAEFIATELGAYVDWDDANSVLTITSSLPQTSVIEVQDEAGPITDGHDRDTIHGIGQSNGNGNDGNPGSDQGKSSGETEGIDNGSSHGNGKGGVKGAALPSDPKSLKQVISEVAPSVVLITTYDASGMGISQGSGVVVAGNTIVTNQHVIHGASKVVAIDSADNLYVCSGTIAVDTYRDLALLKCEIPVEPVALGDPSEVTVGDSVVAVGNPRGLQGTVSTGIVSGPLREFSGVNYLQTTAPTSPGSSGGGLFTMDSSLIGITTLIFKDSQNLNLVVPVSYVKDLMAKPAVLKPYPATQAPNPTSDTKPVARYFDEVE